MSGVEPAKACQMASISEDFGAPDPFSGFAILEQVIARPSPESIVASRAEPFMRTTLAPYSVAFAGLLLGCTGLPGIP